MTRRPVATSDPVDERVLERLGAYAAKVDPVPACVRTAALAGFTLRTLDAELAQLTYDSLLHDPVAAGVRGPSRLRSMSFESGTLCIEVEVSDGERGLRLHGQMAPAQHGIVLIRQGDTERSAVADELGRFTMAGLRRGPVQLRCRRDGSRDVTTDWVVV